MIKPPVIDFHVHLAEYEWFSPSTINWLQRMNKMDYLEYMEIYKNPNKFEELLKANQVDFAVVLAELCPITTGICSNEQVSDFCSGHDSLIPFCSINPYMEKRPDNKLEKLVNKQGFKGLKLYPTYQYFYLNEPMLYPLYAAAQELEIPILFHTGSSIFEGARIKYGDPLYFDDVAVDFPRLKIIMAHGGRGFWYERAYFLSKLHPNVYLEISGLPPNNLMIYFPDLEKISDKVIFGSDWPSPPDVSLIINEIKRLPLTKTAIDNILGNNAARLLNL
ncbi:MAG: amidohydrolase [Firmicutes bacterium]|nr:amidohydrolase [Bacillota bacterium]